MAGWDSCCLTLAGSQGSNCNVVSEHVNTLQCKSEGIDDMGTMNWRCTGTLHAVPRMLYLAVYHELGVLHRRDPKGLPL